VGGTAQSPSATYVFAANAVGSTVCSVECGNTISVTITVVKPEVVSVDFKGGGVQDIYDVGPSPEWIKGTRNEPFSAKRNTQAPAYVRFSASKNLTFSTTVLVRAQPNGGSASTTWRVWPSAEIGFSGTMPNCVNIETVVFNWQYSVVGGASDIPCGTSTHEGYITWDEYKCPASEFVKDKISKSIVKTGVLFNNHTEDQLATNICKNVNGNVLSGFVCYSNNNLSFHDHFRGAMGEHSQGMCCCRAKGMTVVLQVLGLEYDMAFDNELVPPNTARGIPSNTYCGLCGKLCMRGAQGGGIYNNWQGVAYRNQGIFATPIHYSLQGYHISPYSVMASAPNYPNSQPFDHFHAFNYYAWRTVGFVPATGQYAFDGYCIHLPKP
jgi:hypothetical protein